MYMYFCPLMLNVLCTHYTVYVPTVVIGIARACVHYKAFVVRKLLHKQCTLTPQRVGYMYTHVPSCTCTF